MRCNIDAKGKAVRLVTGWVAIAVGVLVGLLHIFGATLGGGTLILASVLVIGGALGVIQGWAGWCAIRAIGIKTRV